MRRKTPEIYPNQCRKKYLLYKRFLRNPNLEKEGAYKSYKNKLNHSVRTVKRLFNEKRVEQLKSKSNINVPGLC